MLKGILTAPRRTYGERMRVWQDFSSYVPRQVALDLSKPFATYLTQINPRSSTLLQPYRVRETHYASGLSELGIPVNYGSRLSRSHLQTAASHLYSTEITDES